ncbi:MAG: hypothetical protein MI725_01740, partial [Pirellulales bacterium]|nr:hypothetical protein [Pirellulales bacterium]
MAILKLILRVGLLFGLVLGGANAAWALGTPSPYPTGKSNNYDAIYGMGWNAVSGAGTYVWGGKINGQCLRVWCYYGTVGANVRRISLPAEFRRPGTHTLMVRACDANGKNCGAIGQRNVVVRVNTAPTVSLSAPS